jgi:HEAT repeat protein
MSERIHSALVAWQPSRGNEEALQGLLAIDPVDIETLIRICSDRERPTEVRRICAVLLGRLHARQAVKVLIKNLWEDETDLAISSGKALVDIRSRTSTQPLLRVLRECPFLVSREAAAKVFKTLKDPKAIPDLKRVFLNPQEQPRVRFQAGAALAEWNAGRFVELFLRSSSDESAEIRFISAYGLGFSGDSRALPVLRRLSTDNELGLGHTTVGEEASDSVETFARRKELGLDKAKLRRVRTRRNDP